MKIELQQMLDECSNELNDIKKIINNLPSLSKEQQYLTNYALIRTCGLAEFVYRSIIADFFSEKLNNDRIDTYLDTMIRQGSNSAKYDNMKGLLKKFDTQWAQDFADEVSKRSDHHKLIDASNSLVTNRHNFAHGKNPTATFNEIINYYFDVVELINIFDSIVSK